MKIEMENALNTYLYERWLDKVQDYWSRPAKNKVIETVEHYAWQDRQDWQTEEIANMGSDDPEFQKIQKEVHKIIVSFVNDNWE